MGPSRLQVSVSSAQCAASGACRQVAPSVFGADDHGWVQVREPRPSADLLEAVLDAVDSCPMAVIEVHDENGVSLV